MIPEWFNNARCVGQDANTFFPHGEAMAAYLDARSICGACPVQTECLNYALDEGLEHGMWGGATPRERRAILNGEDALSPGWQPHGDAGGTSKGYYREKRAGVDPCVACRAAYNRKTLMAAKQRMSRGRVDEVAEPIAI